MESAFKDQYTFMNQRDATEKKNTNKAEEDGGKKKP